MERRFNKNFYSGMRTNHVLPVILYLTIPTKAYPHSSFNTEKRRKSQKQRQRDQDRLEAFHMRKSICTLFPFHSVENDELLTLMPKQLTDQSSNSRKVTKLQRDISDFHSAINILKKDLTNTCSNLKDSECEKAKLTDYISQQENKLSSLEIEISNLQKEIFQKTRQEKDSENLIFNLQEENREWREKFNREIDNNERIRKEYSMEVNQLKSEICSLKSQSTNSVPKVRVGKQCKASSDCMGPLQKIKKIKSAEANLQKQTENVQQRTPSDLTVHNQSCHRCASLYSFHQPNHCPARKFVCENCSKRGHHSLSCLHICKGCGVKGRLYHKPEDCVAREMNCAYCNVRGHLEHVCLTRRYDIEGY